MFRNIKEIKFLVGSFLLKERPLYLSSILKLGKLVPQLVLTTSYFFLKKYQLQSSNDSTPEDWPSRGKISIRNLKASYVPIQSTSLDPSRPQHDPGSNPVQPSYVQQQNPPPSNPVSQAGASGTSETTSSFVLNGISAEIMPGEKVAIVGRSNSGKSSLVLALSRMMYIDPSSHILIDGIDINNVQLSRVSS